MTNEMYNQTYKSWLWLTLDKNYTDKQRIQNMDKWFIKDELNIV